ncbi:lipid droplet-associated hydrolase isoform X2 [Trifolium pratense]|uniref:lipid droplet-associated hydrolase isoform X2 n=1 Tax=Trifolium pratense TaxID=57577 RepID=UPI001E6970B6|nr:lipid droplet-associated hydrolase isoform X2 [Trifolium pratense]
MLSSQMLPRLACWTQRTLSHSLHFPSSSISSSRKRFCVNCFNKKMDEHSNLLARDRKRANFRLCKLSNYTSEILEIQADAPSLHVLVVPGNPGVILFYKDFVEFLYELLGGTASITAIGQVSHSRKDLEHGRLFSLQEQIDHKIDFIKEELQDIKIPIILVGHSIGSYTSIEMFKKSPEKVKYCIGLYPFLTLNPHSITQSIIGKIAQSQILAAALSYLIASLGLLPVKALTFIVRKSLGKSWSANAVEAACSHLSQLAETPDWAFLRERKDQCAFLFGDDDHWGPLQLHEEISKQVPGIPLFIERENHTHGFSCTEAGSLWVAQHVANLIKNQVACANQ